MKISPDLLSDETQTLANSILENGQNQSLTTEQLGTEAHRGSSVTIHPMSLGRTAVRLDNFIEAPEHDNVYDGPSGDAVSLVFDRDGKLQAIQDILLGYDVAWGFDTIADSIIPSRRKAKQAEIAHKAASLIRVNTKSSPLD